MSTPKRCVRTMGNFDKPIRQEKKTGKCRGCHRPVRETVGNCGYCKKCIALARQEAKHA